jgi:hypothetical protein
LTGAVDPAPVEFVFSKAFAAVAFCAYAADAAATERALWPSVLLVELLVLPNALLRIDWMLSNDSSEFRFTIWFTIWLLSMGEVGSWFCSSAVNRSINVLLSDVPDVDVEDVELVFAVAAIAAGVA